MATAEDHGTRRWVCTWLGEPAGVHDMVIVRADSREAAASEGARLLDEQLKAGESPIEIDKVGVAAMGAFEWFAIGWQPVATRVSQEVQCCGGGEGPSGHSGYCPNRRERDDARDY